MTDTREAIHQIEYRWHDRRDLSPVASSMSQESLRGWDSWVRTWVRHPHADSLQESVCYQMQPNGRAALAWRYEDVQAAERDDGSRGRPLVSRVLIGQTSLLTVDMAIVLCRTGLPVSAGPRPGQVATGTELAAVSADELGALVRDQAAELDDAAAHQQSLRQVVTAALSDPSIPLAIHIRDTYMLQPPRDGVQCPLLWGLRRIVWPLLGTAGRGWSFSTFEPPMGDVDPATMPDILFRLAQDTLLTAPARPREEIKVRPFDPRTSDATGPSADLAGWLVTEYQDHGGDELTRLITQWCGGEQSLLARMNNVYSALCGRHTPQKAAGQEIPQHRPDAQTESQAEPEPHAEPEPQTEPGSAVPRNGTLLADRENLSTRSEWFEKQPERQYTDDPQYEDDEPGPFALDYPAFREDTADPPHPDDVPYSDDSPYPGDPDDLEHAGGHPYLDASPGPHQPRRRDSSLGPVRREGTPPPLPPRQSHPQSQSSAPLPAAMSEMLKRLPMAGDLEEFRVILRDVLRRGNMADPKDRVRARREISKDDWYDRIHSQFGDALHPAELAGVFQIVIIPDLAAQDVVQRITEWSGRAHPAVIGALLAAAKRSGGDTWEQMIRILQPKLAHRWVAENCQEELWSLAPPPLSGADSGHGIFSFGRGAHRRSGR